MKKIFTNKLSFLFTTMLIFFISFSFSGCKKSKFNKLISYSFMETAKNLDPQTAFKSEEITLINNIFEGLYKKSEKGGYELGVAREVIKSSDNKKLTFKLKDNVYWRYKNNKVKLSASDFIFAFRRLLDPKTNSSFAPNYFFIKNAQNINEKNAPVESLGAFENENGDFVLELEYTPPLLEELLAATPSMPCNKKFFESTKGRYGTTKENIISNGPFYLNTWNIEKNTTKFRIRKNDKYHNKDNVKIIGVNFSVKTKEEAFNLFKNNEINTAIVDSNQFNLLNKNLIKNKPFQNKVTGIIFNQRDIFLNNPKTLMAMANTIDRYKIQSMLPINQTIASNIIPKSTTILGEPYNQIKPQEECCPKYNPEIGKNFFNIAKQETQKANKKFNINAYSILTKDATNPVLNQILQIWQKDLNFFLKLEQQDSEQFEKKLQNGHFDCALISFNSTFNSPLAILQNFSSNSPLNYAKYEIKDYDVKLNSAANQKEKSSIAKEYFEIEKEICKNGYFIPIIFETEYFVTNNKIEGILFNPASKEFYYAYAHSK